VFNPSLRTKRERRATRLYRKFRPENRAPGVTHISLSREAPNQRFKQVRWRALANIRRRSRRLAEWKASAGLSSAIRWEALLLAVKLGYPEPQAWRVLPRQVSHPLQVRLRGSSDMDAFRQIFVDEEYSILRKLSEPALVLDLGANVGYSAAYFLNVFPKAFIVAVEPDHRNLAICKANLVPYRDRVMLLHGAVWSKPAKLRLLTGVFGDHREWATQVGEPIEAEPTSSYVQAWDVETLIDMSGRNTVDLLKVDIEGAELSVFGTSAGSWLHRVRNICIELHGNDCKETFFAALKDFDYDLGHSGELTICRNLRPRKSHPTKSP
jgi:FkbM family methyltransferase